MSRYLRLYGYFLRFSFSKAMEFRLDFFFRFFMDVIYYIIQFMFFEVIYLHTPLLGGWTPEQLRIFVAAYIFVDALKMTVFANNCWWLPIHINDGALDYYLTKPVSSMFFLSLKDFAANSFLNLLVAIGILVYCLIGYSQPLPTMHVFAFITLLLTGTLLLFFMRFILITFTFWTAAPRGFSDLFFSLAHTMERPDMIFSGLFKRMFTTILPFCLVASYPTRLLLSNDLDLSLFFQCLGTCFIFGCIAILFWSKGLKSYSSASS